MIGDPTLSTMELWGAEYQENDAILVHAESRDLLQSICDRERVPIAFCGTVTGDGRVILDEGNDDGRQHPYDLDLEDVLGGLPPKTFVSDRAAPVGAPLELPAGTTVVRWLSDTFPLPLRRSIVSYMLNPVAFSLPGFSAC